MKLIFNLVLCTCANLLISNNEGLSFENTSIGIILNKVIKNKHEIITRRFLSVIFKNQKSVNRTLDNLYFTLTRVYDILVDTDKTGLKNIMLGLTETFERPNILNSNSILISKTISRFFVLSQHDNLINITKISELYGFYKMIFNEEIIMQITKKEFKFIIDSFVKATHIKNHENKKSIITFDGLVLIEIIKLYKLIFQIQTELSKILPNNIFHHRPYYKFIQNAKESGIFNNKRYLLLSKNEKFPIRISNMYLNLFKSTKQDKVLDFTEQWYYLFHQTSVNPKNKLENILLKNVSLNNNYIDLYIGQLHYFSVLANTEIILEINSVDIFNSCVKLISIGSEINEKLILKEFKDNYESSEEMLALIEKNLREDKLHEFTTVVNMTTYTFKMPANNSEPLYSSCLRISCGHFLGRELIKEYVENLKFKCHLCNILTDVVNYFETAVYEIN